MDLKKSIALVIYLFVYFIERLKDLVPQNHKESYAGIGHTRWATCGGKTDYNAHPHLDMRNRIALIIAQYIGLYVEQGLDLFQATEKTLNEHIKGTWGIVVIDRKNPTQMLVARNGSPLLVGIHDEAIYVASERIAFEKHTSNFISLDDGEMHLLDLSNRKEFFSLMEFRVSVIQEKVEVLTKPKHPYEFFFEQEIDEQPEAILSCLGNGSRLSSLQEDCTKLGGLENHVTEIQNLRNLVIIACGSSFYAGSFAARIFKHLECFNTISVIEASEFTQADLPKKNAGAIFISQSGETADIYTALQYSKTSGLFTIGVVNVVGSLIASNVHCGIYLNCGREVAVPATKSFVCQIIALSMMAIWISHQKEKVEEKKFSNKMKRIDLKEKIRMMPVIFGETSMMIDEQCKSVATAIKDCLSLMILGKGTSSAIAKEGALKIKEVSYIHAEAFSAGEMKHGPIAMLKSNEPKASKVILLVLDDEYFHDMDLALSECKSQKAYTIVISDCIDRLDKVNIFKKIFLDEN